MKKMTICFLVKHNPEKEVLLGFKKAGFGAGKFAGIGGKVEPGETVERAAIREVEEEIGVSVADADLHPMGTVEFVFPTRSAWCQSVAIFTAERWAGEPGESDEMRPEWYAQDRIPYDAMWQDARWWMPPVLEGMKIQAQFIFNEDLESVAEFSIVPEQA